MSWFAAAACAAGPVSVACQSQPPLTVLDEGTVHRTQMGIGMISGTGAELDGMPVTVTFEDGFTETRIWTAGSMFDSGRAEGSPFEGGQPGWMIELTGNSFDTLWLVRHVRPSNMMSISLDGLPADAVFDEGDYDGTITSGLGRSFVIYSESEVCGVVATFRDAIALQSDEPVGDLYRRLEISLGSGLESGSSLRMAIDTDELAESGDLGPDCCPSDLNCDGVTDVTDIIEFFARFAAGDMSIDADANGRLDVFDIIAYAMSTDDGC